MSGAAALVWSGLAVAIAVMMMLWDRPEQGANRQIAHVRQQAAPAARDALRNGASEKPIDREEELAERSGGMSIQASPTSPTAPLRKKSDGDMLAKRTAERSDRATLKDNNNDARRDAGKLAKEQRQDNHNDRPKPANVHHLAIDQTSSQPKNDESVNLFIVRGNRKGSGAAEKDERQQLAAIQVEEKQKGSYEGGCRQI